MTAGPDVFSLLSTGISWLSLLVTVGCLVVCLANLRIGPMIWIVSLGFAGQVAGGLWFRVAIPILTRTEIVGRNYQLLYLVGAMIDLTSMLVLLVGLAAVFFGLRGRLSARKVPLDPLT